MPLGTNSRLEFILGGMDIDSQTVSHHPQWGAAPPGARPVPHPPGLHPPQPPSNARLVLIGVKYCFIVLGEGWSSLCLDKSYPILFLNFELKLLVFAMMKAVSNRDIVF